MVEGEEVRVAHRLDCLREMANGTGIRLDLGLRICYADPHSGPPSLWLPPPTASRQEQLALLIRTPFERQIEKASGGACGLQLG